MTTKTEALTTEQISILRHTRDRAAGGRYCGDSPAMQALVAVGLMESLGRVSWVPDEYFGLTAAGRRMLKTIEAFEAANTDDPFEHRLHSLVVQYELADDDAKREIEQEMLRETEPLDDHPFWFDYPCLCASCRAYGE